MGNTFSPAVPHCFACLISTFLSSWIRCCTASCTLSVSVQVDWWELSSIALSGNSCQLCRSSCNAVPACLSADSYCIRLPWPFNWSKTCVIPGGWTASAAPHIAPPLLAVSRVAVHKQITQLQAERIPKRANASVAMEVGGAWEAHVYFQTLCETSEWLSQEQRLPFALPSNATNSKADYSSSGQII